MQQKRASFQLFTYQIHMVSTPSFLLNQKVYKFEIDPSDPVSVLEKKNEIFRDCIWGADKFFHPQDKQASKVLKTNQAESDGRFLIKIGVEKKANLPNAKLIDQEHLYYPYVFACFDNRPDMQVVAIMENKGVFSSPKVAARIFQENANLKLAPYNLECAILPQFDENDFWQFVKDHPKKIARLQFLIMAPNLPRISQSIPEQFNQLQASVGSQTARLDLQSTERGVLTIEHDNADISGLAKAAAAGGGEIKIQLKGFKKLKTMAKTTKEVTIEEFHVEGKPKDILKAIIAVMGSEDV